MSALVQMTMRGLQVIPEGTDLAAQLSGPVTDGDDSPAQLDSRNTSMDNASSSKPQVSRQSDSFTK